MPEASRLPLYLLPGLGADGRMFAGQRAGIPEVHTIEWDRPRRAEDLRAYTARLAQRIPKGPFALGGASFGGVVAQAVAAVRRPEALILIGTLGSPTEIFAPFRIATKFPDFFFEGMAKLLRFSGSLGAPLFSNRRKYMKLLARMLADADPRFLAWAMRAVLSWDGDSPSDAPTLRIHGDRDRIITPADRAGVLFIRGAGHCVNMTHSKQVNRAIREFLARNDHRATN